MELESVIYAVLYGMSTHWFMVEGWPLTLILQQNNINYQGQQKFWVHIQLTERPMTADPQSQRLCSQPCEMVGKALCLYGTSKLGWVST